MPLILFDPPNESNSSSMEHSVMHGGLQMEKSIRNKYITLSNQLFLSNANQKMISREMLHIMNVEARKQIESLPEAHQQDLYKTLDHIMAADALLAETNYSGLLMIVALQLSLLFTIYIHRIKSLSRIGVHRSMIDDLSIADQPAVYQEIAEKEKIWADYASVKKIIEDASVTPSRRESGEGIAGTLFLLHPERGRWHYLPMIGFVTFREMVDSIFNNIWYVGLTFEPQHVDGSIETPFVYYIHDIAHSIDSTSISDTLEKRKTLETLREFRDFLFATHKLPPVIYSVYFVLFYMLHESGDLFTFGFFNPVSMTSHLEKGNEGEERLSEYIEKLLDKYMGQGIFVDLNNAGRAIPAQYRVVQEDDPNMLNEEEVKMYMDLTHLRYMECWKEFQSTKGGRRPCRTRRTRRNRHNRKRRSTRKY